MINEKKLLHRIQYLAYKVFVESEEGKEFLRLMKALHLMTPTFPQNEQVINQHGGAESWAGFREGQITLIRSIELYAEQYLQHVAGENQENEV